jgi:ArsR family transcriptional regulator
MNEMVSTAFPRHTGDDEAAICNPNLSLRMNESEADQYASIFKALGHPVRIQIMDLIAQGGGQICGCDIERHFDLTQPTISHHLKVLRDAGLIVSEQRGVNIYHKVSPYVLISLQTKFAQLSPEVG